LKLKNQRGVFEAMDDSTNALELLEQDIAERLASVCADMPREDFRELVREIALVKIKYGVETLPSDQAHSEIGAAVAVARVDTQVDVIPPPEPSPA
jgi:hypothetical protein